MAAKQDGKWRGAVTEIIPAPIDKVWPFLTDFEGLHKNFPEAFSSCHTVEGEVNKVGSVRALVAPLPDGGKIEAKERLLHCDDVNHTTSYNMEESNVGWTGYVAPVSAKSIDNGQTLVSWGFEVNPVSGTTEEEYARGTKGLFELILRTLKGLVSK
ncbi:unnamed protein product [Calypogeia fissa]